MNEPQVWTLIGVFAATMFGTLTFGFNSLRGEMRNSVEGLRNEMRTGFASVNDRIDYLDRDVQFLMRKEFGDSPNA